MRYLMLVILSLTVVGCSASRDLDAICEEANRVQTDEEYQTMEPALKMSTFARAVEDRLRTPSISQAWDAIATAAPERRYELLKLTAQESGVEDWECPALQEVLKPNAPVETDPLETEEESG